MLTHERLVALLRYEPETGKFFWLPRPDSPAWNGKHAGKAAGCAKTDDGYPRIRIYGRRLYMSHRLAWLYMTKTWPVNEIDHVNRVRTDNRWVNLREADRAQQQANTARRVTNTSGAKGVYLKNDKGRAKRWCARITMDGRMKTLGHFGTMAEAAAAYDRAAAAAFGVYASVNAQA